MKCFLLTWAENAVFERDAVLRYLDNNKDVESWLSSTGAVFIASNAPQKSLADEFHVEFPAINFILVPVDIDNAAGWTDKVTWEFIRKPRHSPLSYEEAARILEEYGCKPLDTAPSSWWRSPTVGDFHIDIAGGRVDEAQLRLIEADLQRHQRKIGVMQ